MGLTLTSRIARRDRCYLVYFFPTHNYISFPFSNIDVRIQQAELEYDLEREELNLINMQEERRNLHTILDDNDAFQKRTENSLFA